MAHDADVNRDRYAHDVCPVHDHFARSVPGMRVLQNHASQPTEWDHKRDTEKEVALVERLKTHSPGGGVCVW